MVNSNIKKISALFLACLLLCSTAFAAHPATYIDARASKYLSSYDGWVTTSSNGKITISFDVLAVTTMSSVGVAQITVQKKQSNDSWIGITTYYASSTPELLASNTNYHGGSVVFNGAPGTEYRAMVSFYAENSSGSDSRTVYTNSVTAK